MPKSKASQIEDALLNDAIVKAVRAAQQAAVTPHDISSELDAVREHGGSEATIKEIEAMAEV